MFKRMVGDVWCARHAGKTNIRCLAGLGALRPLNLRFSNPLTHSAHTHCACFVRIVLEKFLFHLQDSGKVFLPTFSLLPYYGA